MGDDFRSPRLASSSVWSLLSLVSFFVASTSQFVCHRHLASLRKYSLPSHFFFKSVVCPHYTMECIVYLAMAGLAAPPGVAVNGTLLCVTAFVAINLGVVADTTREWWRMKFGDDAARERWRMLPLVW